MGHQTLRELRRDFITKSEAGYGWLESANTAEKTVVLVHGVTGGKEDMLPLAVAYEQQGFHVYCLDLPGHGDSDWLTTVDFRSLAIWLDGFITLVGAPDVLVSNSFSSAVVYAYLQAGLLPEHTHVILGCPTPDTSRLATNLYRVGKAVPTRIGWYAYTTWAANGIRTSMAAKKRSVTAVRWLIESEKRKRPTIQPQAGMGLSTLLFVENPYRGKRLPASIQRRMTVILGTKDNVVPRRTADHLKELLPHAKHLKAHGAGHILHFEAVNDYVVV